MVAGYGVCAAALRESVASKEQCRPLPAPLPLPLPPPPPSHATRTQTPLCPPPGPLHQVAAVQFHLINTTILFIAREGFRRACLRIDQSAAGASRRVLRIAALTVPAGAVLAAAVTAALLRSVGSSGDAAYRQALIMQGDNAAAAAAAAVGPPLLPAVAAAAALPAPWQTGPPSLPARPCPFSCSCRSGCLCGGAV